MEPTSITVSYSDKRQRERYEPVEFGVEIEVELNEGDDLREACEAYAHEAKYVVGLEMTRRLKEAEMADDIDRDD